MWPVVSRRTYCTVEPALFLYMLASFLSYPIYQQLLFHTICQGAPQCSIAANNHSSSASSCNAEDPAVLPYQKQTSHWILYTNLAASLPAIFLSVIYGTLSDTFGRKPFLVLTAAGAAINTVVIIIVQYISPYRLELYLIGAVLSGLTGGFSVFNLSAYSYVADISCHGDRTQRIGWLEASTYLSSFLSQLVGGVWVKKQGFGIPYFGVLVCQISAMFYVILFLPSATSANQSQTVEKQLLLTNSIIDDKKTFRSIAINVAVSIFRFLRLLAKSPKLLLLSFIFFVLEMNFLGIIDIVVLYGLTRLCWKPDFIGYFLAEKSLFNAIAAMIVLPLLMKCKLKDALVGVIGLVSGGVALIVMGVATRTWVMFLAPLIGAMRGCVIPVVRSMISKSTPTDQQGVMFSGVSIIEATCILFASSLYNSIFPVTYTVYPGFSFFLMALCSLFLVPFMCLLYYIPETPSTNPQ